MSGALPELTIRFVDTTVKVDPHGRDGLVFGRGAALDIDSNPFMHRQVGRFVAEDGTWWVENLSSWTTIKVTAGAMAVQIPGGSRAALVDVESTVSFSAGVCNYEVHATLPCVDTLRPAPCSPDCSTATYEPLSLPLTDEQRLLVVALAEHRLRRPDERYRLPSNRSLARRLGWSDAKFNRKLDHLCRRLDRLGVTGLRATGRRANDRRLHLVDHMISGGFVTSDDLILLDDYPERPTEGAP